MKLYVVEWCGHPVSKGVYRTRREAEARVRECNRHRQYGGYTIRETVDRFAKQEQP